MEDKKPKVKKKKSKSSNSASSVDTSNSANNGNSNHEHNREFNGPGVTRKNAYRKGRHQYLDDDEFSVAPSMDQDVKSVVSVCFDDVYQRGRKVRILYRRNHSVKDERWDGTGGFDGNEVGTG